MREVRQGASRLRSREQAATTRQLTVAGSNTAARTWPLGRNHAVSLRSPVESAANTSWLPAGQHRHEARESVRRSVRVDECVSGRSGVPCQVVQDLIRRTRLDPTGPSAEDLAFCDLTAYDRNDVAEKHTGCEDHIVACLTQG